jgi:hypothetical protein
MNYKITSKTSKKNKKVKPECSICYFEFTKSERAPVKCGHCDYTACKKCVRKYLLGKSESFHCMNCNKAWDLAFARKNLNSSFIDKEYKKHRKGLLFEIEKARLPETMPAVEKYLSIKPLEQENSKMREEVAKLENELYQYRMRMRRNNIKIENYKRGNYTFDESKQGETKERRVFMKGCPVDGCRGFLSSQWKCGICKIFVCKRCMEPIGDDRDTPHECDENSVKTAEMLKKETKNCPSCTAVIYKISGCDQMWCTQCHIAFSWKTGQKVNGVIHNPHFYQWQKNNGGATQNPNATHCGGIPGYYLFRNKVRTFTAFCAADTVNNLMRLHRSGVHFGQVELANYRTRVQRNTDNTDLRVRYLAKEITEFDMKKKLASRDTAQMKARAILDIYELFNNVITEALNAIWQMVVGDNIQCINTLIREVDKIDDVRRYCNQELKKVSINYKQCVKLISRGLYTYSEKFSASTKSMLNEKKYFTKPYKWDFNKTNYTNLNAVSLTDVEWINILKN